jgi:hypothetical protein
MQYSIGPTPEVDARMRREMEEAARAREEAHRQRRERLTAALYALGADAPGVLSDRQALEAAAAEVSGAWLRLVDLEAQIVREKERLALLENGLRGWPEVKAPTSMRDLQAADERRAHVEKVENAWRSVAALTEQAKTDRRELEGYVKKQR